MKFGGLRNKNHASAKNKFHASRSPGRGACESGGTRDGTRVIVPGMRCVQEQGPVVYNLTRLIQESVSVTIF